MKTTILADRVLVITCLSAVLGLAGCQQEGTAEKTGKEIDRAAENAEQKIEQATEKAETKIDAAKESLDKKSDEAGEYIDESTDTSKEAIEKSGKELDQATGKAVEKIEGAKESMTDKAEAAGEFIKDSVITTKVKTAILNDPFLRSSDIEVTTDKGVVKLSGTVDSEKNIGRAMEVASSQENVRACGHGLLRAWSDAEVVCISIR